MSSPPTPVRVDRRAARGQATRELILDAAAAVLGGEGYAAASTRAVAEAAGVPLSSVHYHFGSKGGLLAAVLERENARLLARQQALFASGLSLAQKWRVACEYLDEDVDSGYVRILWELWAAGLADPELAARWRSATAGWRDLIGRLLTDWAEAGGIRLPLAPRSLAALIANLFQGAEVEILAGVGEAEAPHREALAWIGRLIEDAEAGARR